MACNCATSEQLNELYRVYGEKAANRQTQTIGKEIVYWLKQMALILLAIPSTILMTLYVVWVVFWNKNPHINVQNINILKQLKIVK